MRAGGRSSRGGGDGQAAITSFFFKKPPSGPLAGASKTPSTPAPGVGAPKRSVAGDGEDDPAAKRRREGGVVCAGGDASSARSSANGGGAANINRSTKKTSGGPIVVVDAVATETTPCSVIVPAAALPAAALNLAATSLEDDDDRARRHTTTTVSPRVPPAGGMDLASIPASVPERHEAFVLKLSRDPRRRDGTRRDAKNWEGTGEGEDGDGDGAAAAGVSRGGQKMTPLEEQVKKHKAAHPGVVLLIEVGYKFHFYGEDANVASKVLNIFAYQSRNYLTASVPVARLHVYVRRLVEAGHKVGVIRQTETAALKASGETEGGKSGLFERSLVGLYTRSTLEAGVAIAEGGRGTNDAGESAAAAEGRLSSYLLCVAECAVGAPDGSAGGSSSSSTTATKSIRVGVAVVDPSTGDVMHGEFDDAATRPELEARLLRVAPAEVLLVEPISGATAKLVSAMYGGGGSGTRVERVAAASGYAQGGAAAAVAAAMAEAGTSGRNVDVVHPAHGTRRHEGTDPKTALDLPGQTLRAVAVAFDWLRQFGLGGIPRLAPTFRPLSASDEMALSPNVIRQLEMLRSSEGTHRGSLLWLMGSNAATAAGGRLMRRWVAHPLKDRDAIEDRLAAVTELRDEAEESAGGRLEKLGAALRRSYGAGAGGDVERYLARVFHGTATPAELVTALTSIVDFAASVEDMRQGLAGREGAGIAGAGIDALARSSLVRELLTAAADPETVEVCRRLLAAVDSQAARSTRPAGGSPVAVLHPDAERFPEVEVTRAAIADAERALDELLPALRQKLVDGATKGGGKGKGGGMQLVPRLAYITVAQVEHLIELPDTLPGVPVSWVRVSTNKGKKVVRYHPPEVLAAAAALERSRERHVAACVDAWRSFLCEDCAGKFLELRAAVRAAAGLDALNSLAALSRSDGYCRPTILPRRDEGSDVSSQSPTLRIVDGRHPILDATMAETFVPNSVNLRGDGTRALVVTGPNMGGKSCFIRQVALISIMAQCGSWVPAASAELTVLDGVYTRMGASDNLALGASTFLEEMSECSAILASATPNSLVVLDELGRGTSTHDGVAVAHATLSHLVSAAPSLTLFVTHYPSVAREVRAKYPEHCAAAFTSYVEVGSSNPGGGGNDDERKSSENGSDEGQAACGAHVEFMYKLTPGIAHRSFGLNVARMAGLPTEVVRRAGVKAREMEMAIARRAALRTIRSGVDVAEEAEKAEGGTRAALRAIGEATAGSFGRKKPEEVARILTECQSAIRQ